MSHDLTPREVEIVRLISLGCTVKEISKIVGLAVSTIDTHRGNAMEKLGVGNMALLTRMAIKHRICKLNEKLTPAEKRKRGRKRDGWN
ncbi:response regulator transcription factor [Aeoliella sp.]|uniref:response regulator transcription factor n=1 Tax=Aeoliella sp. TaxID=2795800 RepID=UPI003CCC13C9